MLVGYAHCHQSIIAKNVPSIDYMRFLVYRTERKVLFIAPPCRAMPGHAMPCDAMRCAACPPLSIWVCGSRACGEGRVDRRPPHAARELSRLASPLASHPGLRAVRHACPVLRCEAQLRHGPVRRLCTPCRGVVGPRCAFPLAVTLDRRLACFSDSAAPCSHIPSGAGGFTTHEWRHLHTP